MQARRLLLLVTLLAALRAWAAGDATGPGEAKDAFLARLEGRWRMVGTVDGERAVYHAEAAWVLQDGWLRLHMLEASRPTKYEADLYLARDARTDDYVAHWLDQFGAGGARVVGTGKRDGSTLVLTFPYASGEFRDTLSLDQDARHGRLLIEAREPDGSWRVFADYALDR